VTAGLEPAAAVEVRRLGGPEPLSAARGAVRVPGDLLLGARLALGLRSAPRVILELATALPGEADGFQPALSRIAWEEWLPRELSWAVRVTGTTEELRSPLHTARLVKDSIRDRFTARGLACPPVDPRGARVLVDFRLERGTASAGIDLGGHSLHARGTGRQGPAPLREDVAAGLALLAGVDAERALLDPFCGTGTLIAEAAALRARHPAEPAAGDAGRLRAASLHQPPAGGDRPRAGAGADPAARAVPRLGPEPARDRGGARGARSPGAGATRRARVRRGRDRRAAGRAGTRADEPAVGL